MRLFASVLLTSSVSAYEINRRPFSAATDCDAYNQYSVCQFTVYGKSDIHSKLRRMQLAFLKHGTMRHKPSLTKRVKPVGNKDWVDIISAFIKMTKRKIITWTRFFWQLVKILPIGKVCLKFENRVLVKWKNTTWRCIRYKESLRLVWPLGRKGVGILYDWRNFFFEIY